MSLRPRGRGGWHVECLWHLPWRQEGVRGEEERLQAARDWMDQERLSRRGGALCLLPQPQATTQHRMQASRMLAKGPAAITRKRCHAGRREKHSSRVKPLGMSFSSFSPTRAT